MDCQALIKRFLKVLEEDINYGVIKTPEDALTYVQGYFYIVLERKPFDANPEAN